MAFSSARTRGFRRETLHIRLLRVTHPGLTHEVLVAGFDTSRNETDERPAPLPGEVADLGETDRLVERPLSRLGVGQEHVLAHPTEGSEGPVTSAVAIPRRRKEGWTRTSCR